MKVTTEIKPSFQRKREAMKGKERNWKGGVSMGIGLSKPPRITLSGGKTTHTDAEGWAVIIQMMTVS